MDEQTTQQLLQILTQAVQLLQGAGSGMGAPPDAGMGGDPAMMDDGGDMDAPPDAGAGVVDPDEAAKMAMRSRMVKQQGGSNLHDRISALESHTGLRKAATGNGTVPTLDRVAFLEELLLGTEYEGALSDRLAQLEEELGLQKTASATPDDAPEEIDLSEIISTAVQTGIAQGLQQMQKSAAFNPPDIQQMRKSAANQNGTPKRQTTSVASDADLQKAAKDWGMDGSDLDGNVSFGDALLLTYRAQQNGFALAGDSDDD